jgi:predicted component of type VI protein secretion system
MRVRVQVDQPDGQTKNLDAAGESIRLGRDAACEIAVDPIAFPKVSGVHARIEPAREGFVLVHLSRSNRTLVNDAPMESADGPFRPLFDGNELREWRGLPGYWRSDHGGLVGTYPR